MTNFLKCTAVLLVIIVVFGAAMFALDLHTGPIIEQNAAAAASGRLNLVMEGKGYTDITSTLKDVPESVTAVHEEISGLGYVIEAKATSKYTSGDPMDILIGVTSDGKICDIKLVSHSESLIFGENYPDTYIGKDSALSDVELYAGSTFSSTAFKNAVADALNLLVANNLVAAGVKTPEQILSEMIQNVAPELKDAKKQEGSGDVASYYTSGDTSAYIVKSGEEYFLVVVSSAGNKVYDVNNNEVTADKSGVIDTALAFAQSAANDRLNSVMSGATGYDDITSTLKDLPKAISKVHKEKSGIGYVIETTATSQYTSGAPMDIVIGVTSDGKICGIKLVSHSESLIFDEKYPDTYIGKDSALEGVDLYAGSTFSSTAFKTAVSEALEALISNELISAGVKSDEQILTELIATLAPGYNKLEERSVSGNIVKAYESGNKVGFAYIMAGGDAKYLVLVNNMGHANVYDVEGKDVTADNKAIMDEAVAHATAITPAYKEASDKKFASMIGSEITDVKNIDISTYNTVAYAAEFKVGDATYYGFYSRSMGFEQMDVYIIIDANGAIAKVDAKTFIFEQEYFMGFGGMPSNYKGNFEGLTSETFKDQYIIATATMTSNAMKQSTEDAFAAFKSINDGGNA